MPAPGLRPPRRTGPSPRRGRRARAQPRRRDGWAAGAPRLPSGRYAGPGRTARGPRSGGRQREPRIVRHRRSRRVPPAQRQPGADLGRPAAGQHLDPGRGPGQRRHEPQPDRALAVPGSGPVPAGRAGGVPPAAAVPEPDRQREVQVDPERPGWPSAADPLRQHVQGRTSLGVGTPSRTSRMPSSSGRAAAAAA